jgi:SIR2-like domain
MPKSSAKSKGRSKPKSQRPRRRVFIFGAGVSASCGIAVAKDLLREAIGRLAQQDSDKAKRIHNLLRYFYPGFQKPTLNYPNIEDFLNLVEMAKLFNSEEFIKSGLWPKRKLEEVQHLTLKAVTDYIWDRMQQRQNTEAIGAFVTEFVRAGDTFITFNWDLTLERALEEDRNALSFWYSYPPSSSEPSVTLLKPHGSIDWFPTAHLPKGKPRGGAVLSLDDSVSVFTRFNFADVPKMADRTPVIVPPVSAKEFSHKILKRTWRHIYRAVSRATDLFIVGYSLPKEDQFARLVLGRALRSNRLKVEQKRKLPLRVAIVNPDEGAETTFRRLVGPNVRNFVFYQATFENFVVGGDEVL